MPKVEMKAIKDFTYMTRRLTAGDPFDARNPLEARILERVRKVALPFDPTARVAAAPKPEEAVIPTVEQVLEAGVVEEPAPKPAAKKAPARKRKARAKK